MRRIILTLMLIFAMATQPFAAAYQVKQSTTTWPLVFYMANANDHNSALTGLTGITVTLSKNGGTYAAASGTVTEIGGGWYKVAGNATDSNTLGPLLLKATKTGADDADVMYEVVAVNPQSANAYLSGVNGQTAPANWGAMAITGGGAVTVGTNSDKSGYTLTQLFPANFSLLSVSGTGGVNVNDKTGFSLTQSFPANFSSLAIAGGTGGVTVNDKTGFSLTQSFPANFSLMAISGSGAVTVGTNNDKSGYTLTQLFPANFSTLAIGGSGSVTAGIVSDKNGYALSGVTTVNPILGTTQPVNFNNTGVNALVKTDSVKVGGATQDAVNLGAYLNNVINAVALANAQLGDLVVVRGSVQTYSGGTSMVVNGEVSGQDISGQTVIFYDSNDIQGKCVRTVVSDSEGTWILNEAVDGQGINPGDTFIVLATSPRVYERLDNVTSAVSDVFSQVVSVADAFTGVWGRFDAIDSAIATVETNVGQVYMVLGDIGPAVLTTIPGLLNDATNGLTAIKNAVLTRLAAAGYTAPQTAQQIRDANKLAPTAGAPATNSVDEKLDKTYKAVRTK